MAGGPLTNGPREDRAAATDVAARVLALEAGRYEAMQRADAGRLRELFHPDLVYMHSDGKADGADSYAERVASGDLVYHRIEHEIEHHVLLGATCLVWGRMTADVTNSGVDRRISNTSLSVWTEAGGAWLLAAYHPTPV